MDPHLGRADNDRLDSLAPALSRVVYFDRDFFNRRPGRTYRLRRMSEPEIEIQKILKGVGSVRVPSGFALFAAVRRITPNLRFRAFGALIPHGGDDLPEAMCCACFEVWTADRPELRKLAERFVVLHAEGKVP